MQEFFEALLIGCIFGVIATPLLYGIGVGFAKSGRYLHRRLRAVAEPRFRERRSHQRIYYETPAVVIDGQHSLSAYTKDVSDRGLFLVAATPVAEGKMIDVLLTLPSKIGLSLSGKVRCHGRVVRSRPFGGRHSIAVHMSAEAV